MERRRERKRPLLRVLLAVFLGACGGSAATSRPMPAPASTVAMPAGSQYMIGCEESPMRCIDEAKRVCPGGYRTLQAGEGGWYADGEDFRHTPPILLRRPHYRREGWVIQCEGTGSTKPTSAG